MYPDLFDQNTHSALNYMTPAAVTNQGGRIQMSHRADGANLG